MTDPLVAELTAEVRGTVRAQAPLGPLTTLRVGGPARVLVEVACDADLAAVGRAAAAHRVGWLIVGRGSNLLVADAGWPGIAVLLGRSYRGVEVAGTTVRVGAAEPLPTLAVRLADAGLTGFAWGCAVPGTVGGAVRMNAGAHGGEMADHLVSVEVVRLRTGVRETWPVAVLGLRYRRSELPDDAIVVAATLALTPGAPEAIRAEIDSIRRWRREHQPLNEPNCGSVFTNPPGDAAGRLIDAAGGKAIAVGGARVSQRHANFVVTRPGATAADVRAVLHAVRERVAATSGVELRTEVVMVGDFAAAAPAAADGMTSAGETG